MRFQRPPPQTECVSSGLRRAIGWLPTAVYGLAVAAFAKNRFSWLDFPLDDAWIHRVYARAFAGGQGLAYNPGWPEAGSTSPLWALLTAPAHWLESFSPDAPILAVKAIGILSGLVCVLFVQRVVARLARSRTAGAIAAALFALQPKLLFSAYSGMETNLLLVLLCGAGLAWMANKPWWLLALIGLAPTARPEALLALPIAWAGIRPIWRADSSPTIKTASIPLPILPTLAWSGFCFHATGHWFPNTFYVKAQAIGPSLAGLKAGLLAVVQHGGAPGWLFAAGVGWFAIQCLRRGHRTLAPLFVFVGLPILYLVGVVSTRSISLAGYYWTRWTDPGALLLAAAACAGLALLLVPVAANGAAGSAPGGLRCRTGRFALGVLLLACLVPTWAGSFAERRARLASDSRAIALLNVHMGKWIQAHTPTTAVVGVNDAGAIRYFGQRQTLDLLGLNNADLAFGRLTFDQALDRCDWLVVIPAWYPDRRFDGFERRHEAAIPRGEYTVCPAPQNVQVALERLPAAAAPRHEQSAASNGGK